MALNIARFQSDMDKLIAEAGQLELALHIKSHGESGLLEAWNEEGDEKKEEEIKARLKKLPNFNVAYEAWYSESLAVIKQLLPDRLADFREHFDIPKNRKEITYATYRIQDALSGLRVTRPPYDDVVVDDKAAMPRLRQQVAILKATRKRFESSLFDIRQLVQADLFDSEIDSARHLLKNKFLRAAGAIAGVVLEKHLAQVCVNHNIAIAKKNPTISDLNQLLKEQGVIDLPQWRNITLLGDIRNICDHNKQKEPTGDQVGDLVEGVDKVIKTVF